VTEQFHRGGQQEGPDDVKSRLIICWAWPDSPAEFSELGN